MGLEGVGDGTESTFVHDIPGSGSVIMSRNINKLCRMCEKLLLLTEKYVNEVKNYFTSCLGWFQWSKFRIY